VSKSQLVWLLKSAAAINTTATSVHQAPSGQIPGVQPEKGIDGYGAKDFEKSKVLRREWKTP